MDQAPVNPAQVASKAYRLTVPLCLRSSPPSRHLQDLFNVCCDLHKVCIKLAPLYPDAPFPRQETKARCFTRKSASGRSLAPRLEKIQRCCLPDVRLPAGPAPAPPGETRADSEYWHALQTLLRRRRLPPVPQPGEMTRAQLAKTATSADNAFRVMKGCPFFVESKFDGERIQLHRDGDSIRYFSRNMHDHGPFDEGRSFRVFDNAVLSQARAGSAAVM